MGEFCCFSDKAVSNHPSGKSIHRSASFGVLGNIKSCSISQLVDMIFGNNQFQDELQYYAIYGELEEQSDD